MKRLILLALTAALALGLIACAQETDLGPTQTAPTTAPTAPSTDPTLPSETEPDIRFDPEQCADLIGVWYHEVDLDGKLLGVPDLDTMMRFRLVWIFGGNGVYAVALEDGYEDYLAEYEALMVKHMVESRRLIYVAEAKLAGMTTRQANKAWKNEELENAQASCAAAVAALNLTEQFAKLEDCGQYYIEDGKLCMEHSDESLETIIFQPGDTEMALQLSSRARMYESVGISFPVSLVRTPTLPEPPTEPPTNPTEPTTAPTEPSEESTAPSEDPSDPSEDSSEPSEDPSEPSEDPSEPSEDPSEPSEDPSEPSEDPSEPSEDPSEPSEEPSEPSGEPAAPETE